MRDDDRSQAPPPSSRGRDRARAETASASILKGINALLRHRVVLVGLPVALAVLVVVWGLIQPRTYTSRASFTPAQMGEGQLSQISGIAAQFGVQVGGGGGNRSPQFYANILSSEEILRLVVESHFSLPDGPLTSEGSAEGTLVDVYGIQEPDSLRARAKAIEQLRNSVTVTNNLETTVVQVSMRSRRAHFSQQVLDRLLGAVHQFNVESRSSQAAVERAFLEERVQVARRALRNAEDSLRMFLENNRRFQGSPALQFEHDRLQRRVNIQEQIYTVLQQSLEQAKSEEVRTTPVVTVVQPPTRPALPDPRRLAFKALLALFLGGALAVAWALARDAFSRGDWEEVEHVAEFRRLLDETRQDLERAVRPFRRIRRRE